MIPSPYNPCISSGDVRYAGIYCHVYDTTTRLCRISTPTPSWYSASLHFGATTKSFATINCVCTLQSLHSHAAREGPTEVGLPRLTCRCRGIAPIAGEPSSECCSKGFLLTADGIPNPPITAVVILVHPRHINVYDIKTLFVPPSSSVQVGPFVLSCLVEDPGPTDWICT
jgi:hypothetical protein